MLRIDDGAGYITRLGILHAIVGEVSESVWQEYAYMLVSFHDEVRI